MVSALPTRVWCGLEPTNGPSELFDYVEFSPNKKEFLEPSPFEEPSKSRIENLIQDFIDKNASSKQLRGLRVRFIYESRRDAGLNDAGAATVALSTALHLYFNKVKKTDLAKWSSDPISEISKNSQKNGFESVFRFSWQLLNTLQGGLSSGVTAFGSLLARDEPIIYSTNWRNGYHNNAAKSEVALRNSPDFSVGKLDYWGWSLTELTGIDPAIMTWPVDSYIIFSGEPCSSITSIRATAALRDDFSSLANTVKGWFSRDPARLANTKPYILEMIEKEGEISFWDRIISTMAVLTLEGIDSLKQLIVKGSDEFAMFRFSGAINRYHHLLRVLKASSSGIEVIRGMLREMCRHLNIVDTSAAKVTGAGRGGSLLIITKAGQLRSQMTNFVSELQEKVNPNISLDYASWVDGLGDEGVRLEQDLHSELYSSLISKGSIQLCSLYQDSYHCRLKTLDEFDQEMKKMDVLFDLRDQKIYTQGKLIQSDTLHSSKVTCEIFQSLLNSPEQSIDHSQLKVGSYGEDRNLMQSKIVAPFNKLMVKKFGVKNCLEITGSLTEFSIKLNPHKLYFYLVERSL